MKLNEIPKLYLFAIHFTKVNLWNSITITAVMGLNVWKCENIQQTCWGKLSCYCRWYFPCDIFSAGVIHSEVVNTIWKKRLHRFVSWKRAQPTNNTQQELLCEWVRGEVGGLAAESAEVKSSPDAIKILRTSISNECQQQCVVWLGRVLVAHSSWCPEPTEEQVVEKFAH